MTFTFFVEKSRHHCVFRLEAILLLSPLQSHKSPLFPKNVLHATFTGCSSLCLEWLPSAPGLFMVLLSDASSDYAI